MADDPTTDTFWDEYAGGDALPALPGDSGTGLKPLRLGTFSILAAGCLGNLALLFVLVRNKPLHNATNVYLANLAVADVSLLILGAFGVLTDVLSYLPTHWLSCVYITVTTVPFGVSLLTVSLMTLDRFDAICSPLEHRARACKRRSIKLVARVWCCSLVYSVSVNLEGAIKGSDCQVVSSSPNSSYKQAHAQSQSMVYSDILNPLTVALLAFANSLMYFKILLTLGKDIHSRNMHNPKVLTWIRNLRRSRILLIRMIAINTLVYFTCNAPRTVLLIINYTRDILHRPPVENETATVISTALLLLNSCVNPLIYVLTNEKYRHAFREVFLPMKCCSNSTTERKRSTIHLAVFDG